MWPIAFLASAPTNHKKKYIYSVLTKIKVTSMVVACEGGLTQGSQDDIISEFWEVWLEQEKKLYRSCLALMNWNVTEAEDALSSASIKAWEKVQEFAGEIRDLKAWLMQLTSNYCKDIIEKKSRGPAAVEDIERVGDKGVLCTASGVATPMMVLEMEELYVVIRRAVESLPQGQRDNFVLHYYEGLKHEEIAERLGISYDSVCSQIYKARQRLKTQLRGYFCDEEELDRALEPKRKKSPTPRGRSKKRKIESPGSQEKELATVSTAPDGAVGSGLGDCKDGPGEHPADVGEQMVESMQTGAKLSTATDCAPVVGEEKPDLVSGAGEHLAPVGSSMEEEEASLLAQKSEPTPLLIVDKQNIQVIDTTGMVSASVTAGSTCTADDVMGVVQVNVEQESTQLDAREPVVAPVASGEQLLCSPLGGETVSTAPDCVQVSDIVGKNIWDVPALGSARSPSPSGRVEKLPFPLGEEVSSRTVSVRAAWAIALFAVEEKQVLVSGVVPIRVFVEQKLSPVCTRLDGRSHLPTPLAIVEKQTLQFLEEQDPPTASVSAARETLPVTVGEKLEFVSGYVALWAKVCELIKEVCGQGSARSRSPSPPGIVEKLRTLQLSEVLSKETVTAAWARAPVVVEEKPDYVRTVVRVDVEPMLSDVGSRARSPCIRKRSRGGSRSCRYWWMDHNTCR